jgi:hypothetical protein
MAAGNGSGSVPTNSLTSPLVEVTSADPASGDGQSSAGIESSVQTNKTYTLTWGAAPNRSSGALASWASAVVASTPTLHDIPFDNEKTGDTTPDFEFTANDTDGSQSITYQIQIDDTYAFTSTVVDCTSASCGTGSGTFVNTVSGGDTNPFNENERIRFTPSTTLSNSTTYYWRVRASDDGGTNYGSWASIRSFTVVTGTSPSGWFQTTNEQLGTGTLSSAQATTSALTLNTGGTPTFVRANASAGATSTTMDIGSASTNRLVVVVASTEAASSTDITAATVDGKSCVQAREAFNTNVTGLRTEMWYCDEDNLGSSNGTVTIRVFGASALVPADWAIHAILYTGVSQNGPYDTDIDQWSISPIFSATGTLDVPANGLVVAGVANGNGTASSGTSTSPLVERTNADPSSADSVTLSGVESAAQTNKLYSFTWSFTVNREAAVFASWAPAPASTGTAMSPEIDFDWVSGATRWSAAQWTEDETHGTVSMQVYYTASTACDTAIPNGVLSGNATGFSSGPIDLSGLSTSTYNRICLKATMVDSSGAPYVNDWSVTWSTTSPGTPSAAVYQDATADGQVDRIRVTFNQTITSCAYDASDWTVNTAGTISISAITGVSCTGSDAFLYLAVTAAASKTGGATNPVVSYANAGTADSIVSSGGAINAFSSQTVTDGASPVILSTSPVNGATASASDSISADFSETISIASCSFSSTPDPGGFDSITSAANWSAGVNGQTSSRVTLTHTAYASGVSPNITISGCTDGTNTLASGPVSNPWTFSIPAASSGSGSSSGSSSSGSSATGATIRLIQPNTSDRQTAGAPLLVRWSATDGVFSRFRILYSTDGGASWITSVTDISSAMRSADWIVPMGRFDRVNLKIEGLGQSGNVILSDWSDVPFAITMGEPVTTGVGGYDPIAAFANSPDIATDKGLATVSGAACVGGSLIKASGPAVYYCGPDGLRYVFPNEKIYFSWYADFSQVQQISNESLARILIGGNVTYRPGTRLVKIQTDPRVYAVDKGGALRWIASEAVAEALFGKNWNTRIDDLSDAFFVNYVMGEPIVAVVSGDTAPAASAPDSGEPSIAFTFPDAGAILSGTVTVAVTSTHTERIASVAFQLGPIVLAVDTEAPFAVTFDTNTYGNSSYVLTATMTQASGKKIAISRNVLLSNTTMHMGGGGGDGTAPTVSFTAPTNGSTATGTLMLTASASDNTGVASVEFFVGGVSAGTDSSAPYALSVDTNNYSDGATTLTAVARDAAGNSASASISVTIANGPPTVSFLAPGTGLGLSGNIMMQAVATDTQGIASVKFYLDSTLLKTDSVEPYTMSFTATSTSNGTHTLTAVAADTVGHYATTTRSITTGYSSSTTPIDIVILGASTAVGKNLPEAGFSTSDGWTSLYTTMLTNERPGSTVTNLAVSGYTTFEILPTGTTNPGGYPVVSSTRNITRAIALAPDVIIVNMPSIVYTNDEIMTNLATIYATATAAGIPIWFSTSQPQFGDTAGEVTQRLDLRTRIINTYGSRVLDFQRPLAATSDGSGLRELILTYDDVHPTPLGHFLLYEQARAANIPGTIAP